jgi:H+/Cl- antiporter ClcA
MRMPGAIKLSSKNIAATLQWTCLIIPVAVVTGLLVALFLWLLDLTTNTFRSNPWLIWLMPLAGILITWLYSFGKDSGKGNNLIISEIQHPSQSVPARMSPLILFTTVLTHLVGGSAGREGTAVQMGGSIAGIPFRFLQLEKSQKQMLLRCGAAAGFGAVFGTPLAGALFAVEFTHIGKIKWRALLPCLVAALLADETVSLTGLGHSPYAINFTSAYFSFLPFEPLLLLKVGLGGMVFGLTARLYVWVAEGIKTASQRYLVNPYLIPVVGALTILGIIAYLGNFDYLGLGVDSPREGAVSILSSFHNIDQDPLGWWWKLLLTAITLSMGFKGGEVTPLFFVGAALGHTLSIYVGAPVDLFASLGLIAVFAGAANTPLACVVMGIELFGTEHWIYMLIACFAAFASSGKSGIYSAQEYGLNN